MQAPKSYLENIALILLFILLAISAAFAQETNQTNSDYYYPAFKKGKVTFISGSTSAGLLNYNMLTEQLEFISPKKDTLVFDDFYLVDMITIDTDTFYYDLANASVLKLLDNINNRKLLLNVLSSSGGNAAAKTYFISNTSGYVPVTTTNVLKLFPAHASSLQGYIAEHHLELTTEEEIKQLLQYAVSLK